MRAMKPKAQAKAKLDKSNVPPTTHLHIPRAVLGRFHRRGSASFEWGGEAAACHRPQAALAAGWEMAASRPPNVRDGTRDRRERISRILVRGVLHSLDKLQSLVTD